MKNIDLRCLGKQEISFYLGLEEYLLRHLEEDIFFLWNLNPSVVIGRNQLIDGEVNTSYAEEKGVKIYRRPSGGGAIYADSGCFMFTFITKEKDKELIFKNYLGMIINALKELGIDAYFSGRNDMLVNGKKFSGNAMYTNEHGSVLHGTFLYDTDLIELVNIITPDNQKLLTKGIKSVNERVINLKEFLNLSKEELMNYLIDNISETKQLLTNDELTEINLIKKKFDSYEWVYGKNPKYTFKNDKRFLWGQLIVFVDIKNDIVQEMNLKGDFFAIKEIDNFCNKFRKVPFVRESFQEITNKYNVNEYIMNCSNEDFNLMFFGGKDEENNTL